MNLQAFEWGIHKRTIKRNRQHRAHKTKTYEAKFQLNMCWTPLCAEQNIRI